MMMMMVMMMIIIISSCKLLTSSMLHVFAAFLPRHWILLHFSFFRGILGKRTVRDFDRLRSTLLFRQTP